MTYFIKNDVKNKHVNITLFHSADTDKLHVKTAQLSVTVNRRPYAVKATGWSSEWTILTESDIFAWTQRGTFQEVWVRPKKKKKSTLLNGPVSEETFLR